ncbi:MAG: plasmid pRiA4b ORF-3 family protein, partial [Phycisphaerae bacterium]
MARKTDHPSTILELRITLRSTKPPIWRRVAVPSDVTLADLHEIVQIAMGWSGGHLHQFSLKTTVRQPSPVELMRLMQSGKFEDVADRLRGERVFIDGRMEAMEGEDESGVTLGELCRKVKDKITYEYDFGDGWLHTIEVTKTYAPKDGVRYPVCLAGKWACPPEDCGGVWGYYEMLAAAKDPDHPEHETYRDWLAPGFDPEAFDREAVNAQLANWEQYPNLR